MPTIVDITPLPNQSFIKLEAGIKKRLEKSAAYPYDFGVAIGALIPELGLRPLPNEFSLGSYEGDDSLGSLDDLLKGRAQTWWRKLL